jgi:hypothetical protein
VLYTTKGAYLLGGGDLTQPPTECFGPMNTSTPAPPPNWFALQNMKCPGIQELQGVNCAWWVGLTPCTNPDSPIYPPSKGTPVANLFWFREDNGYPWRWMFINRANAFKFPVLGTAALIHFTGFTEVTSTNLGQILSECSTRRQPAPAGVNLDTWEGIQAALTSPPAGLQRPAPAIMGGAAGKLVPGLRLPTSADKLPVWPNRMFLTSFTTPTYDLAFTNQPYPTQVYYDWTSQNMLTRMYLPNTQLMDVILDASSTQIVYRNSDGSFSKCGPKLPVGLPYRDWAGPDHGKATIMAVLDHNPVLGPDEVIVCFTMPSDSGRVFWAWYTSTGEPVLFLEVPQCCNVQLSLTDYYDWMTSPPAFPPGLFVVPSQCA